MATEKWKKENIEKLRLYRRTYYNKHKKSEKKRIQQRIKDLRIWLKEYKKNLKCEKCGENFWACLDFHHLDPDIKEHNISNICKTGWCKKRILKEINKCIVLCANCHRKIHTDD